MVFVVGAERMRFGFYLPNQDPPRAENIVALYENIFEMCDRGEALGFAGCVASEHHGLEDGYIPSPLVELAAIGGRTARLELATGVMLLPLWHPIRVAEDGALIDIMSHGRFALGAGLGLVPREYEMYELNVKKAASRFEEAVQIVRLAWTEERFSFHGAHFQLDDVSVTPKPVQSPPPIRIGGMADKSVERAGRLGDGWLSDPLHGMHAMKRWAQIYREAASASGRPSEVHLMRDLWITDGDVYEEWGKYLERDYQFYFALDAGRFNKDVEPWLQGLAPEDLTFERLREDRVLAGTATEVRDEIEHWIDELQPDRFNLRIRMPEGPASKHARVLEVMEAFATEVMPSFAGEHAIPAKR